MAVTRWNFPDGNNGDALSAALTGADSVVTTGGTGTISTAQALIGTKSARYVPTASGQLLWSKTLAATTTINGDVYVYLVAAPSTEISLMWIGDGSTRGLELRLRDTRAVRLLDSAGTVIWTGVSIIPLNTWVRVAVAANINTTTGTMQAAWYTGHDVGAVENSGVLTAQNTGATCTRITAGFKARPVNNTATGEAHIGSWAYDPATASLLAPYDPGPPPPPEPWKLGTSTIAAVRLGTDPIDRAWLGQSLVWPYWGATRMTVSGTAFAPEIELKPGSTATVTWLAPGATIGGTVTEPTFSWGSGGSHIVSLTIDHPEDLWTLNCGFDHLDDGGQYGPGATYDKAPEPITGIIGLTSLIGLRRFLAANGSLTGHLDFTGLGDLEFIECFGADVQSLDLTGCSSLIRLCVEANQLTNLDLNPVRTNLFDLRAADQQGGSLTFATITGGNFTNLYHFCVRTQTLINAPGLSIMPVIEQYWCWSCGLTDIETPISTILYSPQLDNNFLPEAEVDALLIYIRDNVTAPTAGNVALHGTNAPPSAAGASAAATIDARPNWTVTTA